MNIQPRAPWPGPPTLARAARQFAAYVLRRIDERRHAARHRAYVDELGHSGDLEAVLEVVGASRDQLHAPAASPLASTELLQRVLARLGYTHLEADVTTLEEIRSKCRTCTNGLACRRWGGGQADAGDYRAFCANAGALDTFGVPKRATAIV